VAAAHAYPLVQPITHQPERCDAGNRHFADLCLAAELLGGMAAITGTFIAGLMFARTPEKGIIETNLHAMAYAFFVPIFFVGVGLSVDLHSMSLNTLWLILAISVIAMVGKILGVAPVPDHPFLLA